MCHFEAMKQDSVFSLLQKTEELDKLNGLVELTSNQPDLLKMYLVNKIGPIEFNTTTNNELDLLIPFTKLLLTLNDTIVAKNSLNKLLTLKINKNTINKNILKII